MYKFLAIGFSAGGMPLTQQILAALPKNYPLAVAVVCHLPAGEVSVLADVLNDTSRLPVVMASDKMPIQPGRVHVAPPDYHLLVESRERFSLSVDAPVMSVRPSINVLFESAAEVFEAGMIAVTLSGANSDGAEGMARVHDLGGMTIALSPLKAEFRALPEAVVNTADVDYISNIDEIIALLCSVEENS
jgi:two-component system chemotaxis response regulator CheB